MENCFRIKFFNWLKKNKKFLINRTKTNHILKKSKYNKNLKGYFCRVALEKEYIRFNRYFLAKIFKISSKKKEIKKKFFSSSKKLLLKFNKELKLFPSHVISNKFPKYYEIKKFFTISKKIKKIKFSKKVTYFLKLKKIFIKKNQKNFKIKLQINPSYFFNKKLSQHFIIKNLYLVGKIFFFLFFVNLIFNKEFFLDSINFYENFFAF